MRIAIIGGGISGMLTAYLLSRRHDVTLFEANDYLGGHTRTLDVQGGGSTLGVDTGFIVFNERTYPNFCRLLDKLQVASRPAPMTFSVSCERTGLEYGTRTLGTLFAQRRNLFSPSFIRMIREIFRLRREFDGILESPDRGLPLGELLEKRRYSRRFIEQFLVPFGASIWSVDADTFHRFPAETFVRFFKNHGFFEVENPVQWRVVTGGSRSYIGPLSASFSRDIRLECPVTRVARREDGVSVATAAGREDYDEVVLAVHSDQALAMLADPTPKEREILGSMPYVENEVTLHTDRAALPRRRPVWSSWNYIIPRDPLRRVAVTYDMNILQGLETDDEYCVTLNRPDLVDPGRVVSSTALHHPVYLPEGVSARSRFAEISGADRTHYCGAYWGYGFHEDGVRSALEVGRHFGEGL